MAAFSASRFAALTAALIAGWMGCPLGAAGCPLGAAGCPLTAGEIFSCERDGVREFSDRPCQGITGDSLRLPPINVVGIPPLDKSEQAQLDALAREGRLDPARAERARDTARRELAHNAEACAEATARLEAIREQRRRGYRLKDAARLKGSAEALTRDIRRFCR